MLKLDTESIYPLYQSHCTEIEVLSLQKSGKTVDYACFTFVKVGNDWYRLSFVDRLLQCTLDKPTSIQYAHVDGDPYSYKTTSFTAVFFSEPNRITDVYYEHTQNLIQAHLSFLNGRICLSHNVDTGRTRFLLLN